MKPVNLLITTEKEDPNWESINVWDIQVKIVDFGMATVTSPEMSEHSMSMTAIGGTPGFLSPKMLEALMESKERLRSNFTLDYFAVGVISFAMVSGGRVFQGMYYNNTRIFPSDFMILFIHKIY